MYHLIVDTAAGRHYQAAAGTGDETLDILRDHLARHLADGPVGWAITSPWGAVHLGRINLNGNTDDVDGYLGRTLCGPYGIRDSLARGVLASTSFMAGHPLK